MLSETVRKLSGAARRVDKLEFGSFGTQGQSEQQGSQQTLQ